MYVYKYGLVVINLICCVKLYKYSINKNKENKSNGPIAERNFNVTEICGKVEVPDSQ
jgi:hypothetical protein